MDVSQIIGQVVQSAMANPDTLTSLMEHPYSTIEETAGVEDVSQDTVAQVLTGVSALAGGNNIDFGSLASTAATLLGQNGGSAHTMATNLIGGGSNEGGADAAVLNGLASAVTASGIKIPGVDLSDGFGLDDLIGLATHILAGK